MSNKINSTTLTFVEVMHDSWCPTLASGHVDDCHCSPSFRFHNDQEQFVKTTVNRREARRKAARVAAKAMEKTAKQA